MSSFEGISAAEIAKELKAASAESRTEEDFKIRAEYILRVKALEKMGVKFGRYEYTLVSGVRPDALYGHVIIEYEAPGTLATRSGFYKAVEQTKRYIMDEAKVEKDFGRYFGVIIDGQKIAFIRYRRGEWIVQGPFDITRHTILRLLEALRGLQRKPLRADLLIVDLGPRSPVARCVVGTLYKKLKTTSNLRVIMLYEDWKRVFSQVCAYSPEKLKGLEEEYGLTGKVDYEALLFAIHTYYALVMKLLAAEVAVLYGDSLLQSYFRKLEDAFLRGPDKLRDELAELEEGGIFRMVGITNFLEADYFAWYLDVWDDELADAIRELVKVLSDYEPGTAELEPEVIRDLFKRLYQHLVPKKIRHDLGEYYTPDWLAELVLNEVGFTLEAFEELREKEGDPLAPLRLRLLDPACGSGTFLVLAIKRLKEYCEEHFIDRGMALEHITRNVVGFDLNPLAVIAARTNYLLALGDYIRYRKGPMELPVYLADSILIVRRGMIAKEGYVEYYVLKTSVGEFLIPAEVINKGLLSDVLAVVEDCLRMDYTPDSFEGRLRKEFPELEDVTVAALKELYKALTELRKQRKDDIWVRILKNSFAPYLMGRFDFVVGNPPWVNWENLPEDYREMTRPSWEAYNILPSGRGLGRTKKDIAMLFVYRCIDRYLKDGGVLGFLITQTVFKSMAGMGFRRFFIPGVGPFRVLKVHDMVNLLPFEGAQNRTACLICRKGERTEYPVPYIMWFKRVPGEIGQDLSLEEVMAITERVELAAKPLEDRTGPWSTLTPKAHKAVEKVVGQSAYRAYAGVYVGLNAAYWVQIIRELPGGLVLVRNILEGAKRKVKEVEAPVEAELVYPLLRGRDVSRWLAQPTLYIVMPTDENGRTLPLEELRVKYPNAYKYFLNFFKQLITRGGEPYRTQLKPWRELPPEKAEKIAPPFYMLFNVTPSLAPYKTVWRYIAGDMIASVVSPIRDKLLGHRLIVTDHRLMLIPLSDLDEAYFICALLNSTPIRLAVRSYMVETQISVHVIERLTIPQYNPDNPLHNELVELSKRAHELARAGDIEGLREVEARIDELVAELYGITDEELIEMKKSLLILLGQIDKAKGLEILGEKLAELRSKITRLMEELKAYEEEYGLSSQELARLWDDAIERKKGLPLPDEADLDLIEWRSLYEMYKDISKEIERLKKDIGKVV